MLSRIVTRIALWTLRRADLATQDRSRVLNAILENIGALPFRGIITISVPDQTLLIRGRALNFDQATAIRESARGALKSTARRLIKEQLLFEAVQEGVHKGLSDSQILFSKAALWVIELEEKYLEMLAGSEVEPGEED